MIKRLLKVMSVVLFYLVAIPYVSWLIFPEKWVTFWNSYLAIVFGSLFLTALCILPLWLLFEGVLSVIYWVIYGERPKGGLFGE